MELTVFLAQVFGIYMLVLGAAMLLRKKELMRSMEELVSQKGNMLFFGAIVFLFGVGFILKHNLWGTTLEMAVSIMLWGATIKGLSAMLFPEFLKSMTRIFTKPSWYMTGSLFVLVVGVYLTIQGFGA